MSIQISGRQLLDKVYSLFGGAANGLIPATSVPMPGDEPGRWTDIGEWTTLASRLGAEMLLFVQNDPVFIFSSIAGPLDDDLIYEAYRRAWCMSGPFCLFLALPNALHVYALTTPPLQSEIAALDPLIIFERLDQVDEALGGLSPAGIIEKLAAGAERSQTGRADIRLVNDLKRVRQALISSGMAASAAHSLIGRSILIRYLEDRQIIGGKYFRQVAGENSEWLRLLSTPPERPVFGATARDRLFDRVLLDAKFTLAFFDRLAKDFNGDLFAIGEKGNSFKTEHLLEMRKFLLGDTDKEQPELFFWAYDFEIVPLSLISSIYEEFYHAVPLEEQTAGALDDNTHFTPITLVQDVLDRLLPVSVLETRPRILDPACGSGIFLVEAFKRMVRFEVSSRQRKLTSSELRLILQNQICGVELRQEAARVAAFSLYLALLDSQDPSDILAAGPMPHLIGGAVRDDLHFGTVLVANAFDLMAHEREEIDAFNNLRKRYAGKADVVELLAAGTLDLRPNSFDVIVGNPPWQEAADYVIEDGKEALRKKGGAARVALLWAQRYGYLIGDKSYSQLFLYRCLSLLKPKGRCGLLVSAKVLWNARDTSRAFRRQFLGQVNVHEVVNYTHVRRLLFAEATAPFMFLHYSAREETSRSGMVSYWSARRTSLVEKTRTIGLMQMERHFVRQTDLEAFDYLWKTYWWGNHRDAALIGRLGMERPLSDFLNKDGCLPGYGWQKGSKPARGDLATLRELSSRAIEPFGPSKENWFGDPPKGVGRQPDERLYRGMRLLTKTGISEPQGTVSRLETAPFSFRHTVYCVPLDGWKERDGKIAIGVFWSSLGRYRLFMTAGSWGGWFDKVTGEDILSMPLRLEASWGMPKAEFEAAAETIAKSVTFLQEFELKNNELTDPSVPSAEEQLEMLTEVRQELDRAVYDLFELSEPERNLIDDFWKNEHDFFWKGPDSTALLGLERPEIGSSTTIGPDSGAGAFSRYISAFAEELSQRLSKPIRLSWSITGPETFDIVGIRFNVTGATQKHPQGLQSDPAWESVLERMRPKQAQDDHRSFFDNRPIRISDNSGFMIVKSNKQRNWTATRAREDAEAVNVSFLRAGQNLQ
ncbi:hypothetical protein DEM27_28320 [Metarhizobium album]|uniref:site-specific DNA-methyltransferase (adenine-specific) n=1 Tax=Metarhizobium album TaxID=2182425 RepID=A0A2U2DIC4_9HYPH|nr:DNA methyltransferase [Rhizobium album]PWE52991.1 hypothetical protein DEM27_28320 [Rhizobium album]